MKYLIALLFLTLMACGTDGGGGQDSQPQPEIQSQGEPVTTNHALALDTADDLPDCKNANQNQLVYVIAEDQFFTCDDGDWIDIDIQGQDGSDGVDGADASQFWEDPVTGELWYLAGQKFGTRGGQCVSDSSDPKSGYYRYADLAEIQGALDNGMLSGYDVRVSIDQSNGDYIYPDNPYTVNPDGPGYLESGFVVCIYQG